MVEGLRDELGGGQFSAMEDFESGAVYHEEQKQRRDTTSHSAYTHTSSNQDEEEYDTFDGEAVQLGMVEIAEMLASESQVAGQSRRVTS